MRVALNYGRDGLNVELDDAWAPTVIEKPAMPVLANPQEAVQAALSQPVGLPPLKAWAQGKRSACILICDITRPVPNHLFLRPLIETLMQAGLAAADITILIATGLHRPNEGAELAALVGDPWVLERVKVVNHFARRDEDHIAVGVTSKGNRVKLDRRFVEADIRIATGLVEPHFMAGYSGGRKVIAPGIAHQETITTFHSSRYMEHARAVNCVLDGNPLHEDQLEIVAMLGGALALNCLIDDKRQLSFVNFGEIVSSHLQAVAEIRRYAEVPVAQKFATVVTSAAGYPLDLTYYQTIKGMVAPLDILRDDGDLIIASQCQEGFGSAEFEDAQRRLVTKGKDAFLQEITAKRYADIDEWQTEMQLKPMRVGHIHLYAPALSAADAALTGVNMVGDVAAAVAASIARSGDPHIAVIPEGPYVIPVYRPDL